MKLFMQIAQSIVEQTSSVLEVPMSITDEKGMIIGCSDPNRIGTYHEATKEVFKMGKTLQYTEENVARRKNVLPGVATPIFFQQEPIGVLGIIGDPKKVKKYVQLVRNHVEMLLHETIKAETFSLQLKAKENFIQYLLHQRPNENKAELINYCEMMGFNVDIPRTCLLIHISHHEIESNTNKRTLKILQYDLFHLIRRVFNEQADDIVSAINIKQWLVLKGTKDNNNDKILDLSRQALEAINQFLKMHQIDSQAFIAIGNCYHGVEGISRSYQQALKLISIRKQSPLKEAIYTYNDWQVLMNSLVDEISPSFMEEMKESILQLSEHPNASVLIETFLTYCHEGLNMSKAARTLYIHRNTLLYRLNQINEMLGIDSTSFEQCLFLYLAIKGNKLEANKKVTGIVSIFR